MSFPPLIVQLPNTLCFICYFVLFFLSFLLIFIYFFTYRKNPKNFIRCFLLWIVNIALFFPSTVFYVKSNYFIQTKSLDIPLSVLASSLIYICDAALVASIIVNLILVTKIPSLAGDNLFKSLKRAKIFYEFTGLFMVFSGLSMSYYSSLPLDISYGRTIAIIGGTIFISVMLLWKLVYSAAKKSLVVSSVDPLPQ